MAARSKARKRALDILFEAEMRGESPLTVLEARTIRAEPPVSEYAAELVRGVQAHRDEIDGLLAENSRGWSLDRMPAVDRNILRIGGDERLCGTAGPPAGGVSEGGAPGRGPGHPTPPPRLYRAAARPAAGHAKQVDGRRKRRVR